MSQHDLILDNQAGAALRSDLNNALQALGSNSIGNSAPATMYAGMIWIDTGTSIDASGGPWIRKRNSANSGWVRQSHADSDLIAELVGQAYTGWTSTGSAPSFAVTPLPAWTAYSAGQRLRIKLHAAPAGSDTLNVSGLGAKTLKQYDPAGTKIAAMLASGMLFDCEYDGTDMVVLNPLPAARGVGNRVINGDFRVAQRLSTTALNGGRQFGPCDRFAAQLGGSAVSGTLTRDTAAGANTSSGNALHLSSISYTSGNPAVSTRIEAKDTASLNGKQITMSCKVYHDFGSSRNFGITLIKANAADDFSAVTSLGSGTGISCATGAWTQISYTLTLGTTDASNGLEITVSDYSLATIASKNVKVGDFQLVEGGAVTPYEPRPYELELALCQRHLPVFTASTTSDDIAAGYTTTNNLGIIQMPFAVEPRIPPTGIITSAVGQFTINGFNGATSVASALTFQRSGKKVCAISFTGTGNPYTAQTGCYMYANTSGAQILFTGAEL